MSVTASPRSSETPSSFRTTASVPTRSNAASTEVAVWANIGCTGRPTCNRKAASPAAPETNAASATAGRSPVSIAALRISTPSTPAARATASVIRPASAPWWSSPPASRARNSCSAAVCPSEQLGELSAPYAGRAGATGPFDPGERPVHVAYLEVRCTGRSRQLPQGGPADAGAALPELAGQVAHCNRYLARRRSA
jgi:hypothetical protein